jgi:hypothetical protein
LCNFGTGAPLVQVPLERSPRIEAALASELGGHAMPISDGAEYSVDELAAVALSGELARRKVDRNARAHHEPVGPQEAARTVGFNSCVAFHPDRLVRAEMLDFGYRRLNGRTRPIAQHETEVHAHSERRYPRYGSIFPKHRHAYRSTGSSDLVGYITRHKHQGEATVTVTMPHREGVVARARSTWVKDWAQRSPSTPQAS